MKYVVTRKDNIIYMNDDLAMCYSFVNGLTTGLLLAMNEGSLDDGTRAIFNSNFIDSMCKGVVIKEND